MNNYEGESIKEMPPVLTVPELAAYLRIGRGAAYNLVRYGVINSVRSGRLVRIPRTAVEDYLNGGEHTATSARFGV